jgi:hypothetical protein
MAPRPADGGRSLYCDAPKPTPAPVEAPSAPISTAWRQALSALAAHRSDPAATRRPARKAASAGAAIKSGGGYCAEYRLAGIRPASCGSPT